MSDQNAKNVHNIQAGLAFERPLLALEQKIQELRSLSSSAGLVDLSGEVVLLEERLEKQTREVYSQLTPWERVNVARHANPRELGSEILYRHKIAHLPVGKLQARYQDPRPEREGATVSNPPSKRPLES